MNFRIASLCGALALVLTACPPDNGNGGPDAGPDSGLTTGTGACSGGCGPNQVCDEARRVCVDGCQGGCAVGQICVNQSGTFTCVTPETSCNGVVCGPGQTTCIDGQCSCLPFTLAARDTCADFGKVCHQPYNGATASGGECEDPQIYEFCNANCPGGNCGVCPAGQGCDDRLFGSFAICAHGCADNTQCASDEFCYPLTQTIPGFCYPKSLFGEEFDCNLRRTNDAGEPELYTTFASDECLLADSNGEPETTPTGTCSWALFRGDVSSYPFTYCRSPGPVPEFGACKTEQVNLNKSVTCAQNLECVPVGESGDGICLSICNAKLTPTGGPTEPSCGTGESCVNFLRFEDDNSVVGACMQNCNVFSNAANFGCGPAGSVPTSCVPTTATGTRLVTGNGSGLCIPQRANPGAEGAPCANVDPFQGATCQSGLICAQTPGQSGATCVKPCDLECVAGDAGTPARCMTEANATCGTGKTCTQVQGSSAILGYCL